MRLFLVQLTKLRNETNRESKFHPVRDLDGVARVLALGVILISGAQAG